MKVQKTKPSVNLQKSSILFMQLGLILAMLIVYVVLEHESYYEIERFKRVASVEDDEKPLNYIFRVEKPKKKAIPKKKILKKVKQEIVNKKIADKIKVVNNNTIKKEESIFKTVDIDDPIDSILNGDDILSVDGSDVEPVDAKPVPFVKVEIAPAFPGCEKETTNEGRIACFNRKIKKHINTKFDGELVQNIGLEPGKIRINVEFVIDKFGEITNLRVNAPHYKLDKETRRIISSLPQMTPARQRLNNVPVQYRLPILLKVEEE